MRAGVVLPISLAIIAVLGIILVLVLGGKKGVEGFEEGFEDAPKYNIKESCPIYYTNYKDQDLLDACDQGDFDHNPLYYDIKIKETNDNRWRKIKTAYADLPPMAGAEGKRVCKVEMPGWKQYGIQSAAGNSDPVTISQPLPGDTRGQPENWAHCIYRPTDATDTDRLLRFSKQYADGTQGLTIAGNGNGNGNGEGIGISINGDSHVRMVMNNLAMPKMASAYCNLRPGGVTGTGGGSKPFMKGFVVTMNADKKVTGILYIFDGRVLSWDQADVIGIFSNGFGEDLKSVKGSELLYKVHQNIRYGVVLVNKDLCGQFVQTPMGNANMFIKDPILVKSIPQSAPNAYLYGNMAALDASYAALVAESAKLTKDIADRDAAIGARSAERATAEGLLVVANGLLAAANANIDNYGKLIKEIKLITNPANSDTLGAGKALFSDSDSNSLVSGSYTFKLNHPSGSLTFTGPRGVMWATPAVPGKAPYMLKLEAGGLRLYDDNDVVRWDYAPGCEDADSKLQIGVFDNAWQVVLYRCGQRNGLTLPPRPILASIKWAGSTSNSYYPWNLYYRFKYIDSRFQGAVASPPSLPFGPMALGNQHNPTLQLVINESNENKAYKIIVMRAAPKADGGAPADGDYVDYQTITNRFFTDSGPARPAPASVDLYQHTWAGGYRVPVVEGQYPHAGNAGVPDNDISSVYVPNGLVAKLYEHPNYQGGVIVTDTSIGNLVDRGFNDVLSSIIIEKKPAVTAAKTVVEKTASGGEGGNLAMACPPGYSITGGNVVYGGKSVSINGNAINKNAFTYNINNDTMGGDPRPNVYKSFTAAYKCST